MATIPSTDKLLTGFTGLAWLAEHFRTRKWSRHQDPNQEIDKYLESKINLNCKPASQLGLYGLADDWVGYGIYALERWPHGRSPIILEKLIKLLEKKATYSANGVAWYTTKKSLLPFEKNKKNIKSGNYNLGVAHGLGGVIGFLTEILKREIEQDTTEVLLRNSIKWLISQDDGKHFGYYVPKMSYKIKRKPRLGWCYGDLGLSLLLLNAARILKDTDIEKKAVAIGKRACLFTPSNIDIKDAYLCHGTSSAFHIFNRLYQKTGDLQFLNNALMWHNETLPLIEDRKNPIHQDFDLVMGTSGIGLTLLAGISHVEPTWDRLLMLSSQFD